jgi:hypothetical protein
LAKAAPLPIAATIALAMIGPMPGTVINCRQARPGSWWRHGGHGDSGWPPS